MKESKEGWQRQRYTATERRQWIEWYRQSGLTQARFAQEHGLNHGTLVQWLCKARRESGERKSEAGGFIEMTLPAAKVSEGWVAELAWPDGRVLKLSAGVPPGWVAELLTRTEGI